MSWLFSRALVEAFSAVTCSDGELCAPLNVMPTPHKFWRNDKTMEPCDLSQFGLMCAALTADRGEDLLTSFRAGFPARTSPSLVAEKASPESVPGYGLTWRASLAKFDPSLCTWKTVQLSLLADSELSSVTWPRSGMTAAGQCWELPMLERRTSGIASGLWPTPTVCGNYNRKGESATSGDGLITALRTWPTPLARDSRTVRGGARSMNSLGSEPLITQAALSEGFEDGRLNPEWVEWLMGWPMGWTELKPLATARFHEWQQQHSANCPSNSEEHSA